MDILILNFIQINCHNRFTDLLFPFVTMLGNGGAIWIAAGACLSVTKKYRRYALLLFASLMFTALINNLVLQPLVARPRPFTEFPGHLLLIAAPRSYSFPSGHAATSFCAATVLFSMNRKIGSLGFFIAFVIAFSRVFLFVHYPSDILAGALLGIFCSRIIIKYADFLQHYFNRKIL